MNSHTLTGLDAQNPLGFLAALGLLRILDDHARRQSEPLPQLAFVDEGQQVAQLRSHLGIDAIKGLILEDAVEQGQSRALRLAYIDQDFADPDAPRAVRDLKPPPAVARLYLRQMQTAPRRDADLAAAFFSELVQDNNGNTKPTALHFTAGKQVFLTMVEALRTGVAADDINQALLGPWTNSSQLPSLSWDAAAARNYALRASNPAEEKRGSIAAANWLAVHGLGFFTVAVDRQRLKTTGVEGGWKDSTFSWPLWSAPATAATVMALLRCDPRRWTAKARSASSITLVLRAGILRSDQGGYGSFTPASVVPPSAA
jgi:hypothetical protein